jgi:hypothetical protein
MTAQVPDTILIDNKPYAIAGIEGDEIFTPQSFGISPGPANTACWRGYVCQYKIENELLLLDELQVSIIKVEGEGKETKYIRQTGPQINGVEPKFAEGKFLSSGNLYENLNLPIPFSGSLQAGDGFIRELYVHMGFHPAWKYETVLEIKCENGKVTSIEDISKQMEALRNQAVEANHPKYL